MNIQVAYKERYTEAVEEAILLLDNYELKTLNSLKLRLEAFFPLKSTLFYKHL